MDKTLKVGETITVQVPKGTEVPDGWTVVERS